MKNLEITKMIFGFILIVFSIIGMIAALSYQFEWNWFSNTYNTFGRGVDGGASNLPIFYGLSAFAGAILLAKVRKEEKTKEDK